MIAFNVIAGQYVVELDAPFEASCEALMQQNGLIADETLSAGADSYVMVTADNEDAVRKLMQSASITPEKISEVLFINSPVVGGGEPAESSPREGHQVFVIERPIAGVGFFGLEKKQKIARGSNASHRKVGRHHRVGSLLSDREGTYCVYRADHPDTLRQHGALAGAPIGKPTRVKQELH